ncbi:MAG: DUF1294 domain-containing protein [Bacillota bacterium]|nr:DUF1294 domain-containing protein [Bacillota bacterium]
MDIWLWSLVFLLIINMTAFIVAGVDKYKAKRRKWRVPEKILFLFGILGGCPGLYCGFLTFRHKTKHLKFMVGIPLIFIAQFIVAVIIFRYKRV